MGPQGQNSRFIRQSSHSSGVEVGIDLARAVYFYMKGSNNHGSCVKNSTLCRMLVRE